MDEIIELLKTYPAKAMGLIKDSTKPQDEIEEIRKEYRENKRDARDTQIGNVQKDKSIGKGETKKTVPAVKIPIPFARKIVNTATAFEVGEPITMSPSVENELAHEITRLWRTNRLDSILQQAISLQKSELQCAVQFYFKDVPPGTVIQRIVKGAKKILGFTDKKQIKAKLLQNKNGIMTPVYDAFGDMVAFAWEFAIADSEGKVVKQVYVYDDTNLYHLKDDGGYKLDSTKKHGFAKIPIVYFEQEEVEWKHVQEMIDRVEVTLSKLSASNDYSGHPILLLYGEVEGAPDKDEDGKAFRIPMKQGRDGKWAHGDVKFAQYDQAPESIKLELEYLEKYILSLSSTPDLSFESLKGLGNISGVAIRLMFLDAIIKAKMNEGTNRTSVERIINVMTSGTITTTGTKFKDQTEETFFTIKFNSILPDDLKTTVETLARAVEAGIMSVKLAVEQLDVAEDAAEELLEINNAKEAEPGNGDVTE